MCHPQQTFLSVLLVVVMIIALATLTVAAAAAANLSEDANILLQEQAWAQAFQWNSSSRPCRDWFGVQCDTSESHITALNFPDVYSHARDPTDDVETISVSPSPKADPLVLPDSWSQLAHMQSFIYTSSFSLHGPLPSAWSKLDDITQIVITGGYGLRRPSVLASRSACKYSGTLKLPYCGGRLNGSLPEAWGSMRSLGALSLPGHTLHGPLPTSWSSMTNLSILNLSSNNLNGTLPESWSSISNLTRLDLSDNTLTGTLPGSWSNIDSLSLSSNFVDGLSADHGQRLGSNKALNLSGFTYCPQEKLSHLVDTGSPTCSGYIRVDKDSWERHCKREPLLEACTYSCNTLSADYPELCVAKNANLTLILLWCALAGLLSIMFSAYMVVRIKLVKHNPGDNSRFTHMTNKIKQGWARTLQWRPWGVKAAALFGLATFWYDKGSDIKLLADVWGHTWTGYALLVFLLYQYVLQGYILVFQLMRARNFTWLFEARLFRVLKGHLYFAFMICPITGVLMMIGLDVSLFVSDLGYSIPFIDRHFDLEEYQLFRDIGRALFGTVPTAILQSVTFTTGSTPQNGLVLTTQTFVSAIVASELQLVKVTGELMYLALQGKAGMHTVFWRLLVGKHVVEEALESKSSDLLPQARVVSAQPDIQ